MMALIKGQWVDVGMAKVVNEIFLNMVFCNYWKLIEHGMLRPGSPESEVLLTSVRVSQSPYRADLVDFKYIHEKMLDAEDAPDDEVTEELAAVLTDDVRNFMRRCSMQRMPPMMRLLRSWRLFSQMMS